MASLLMRAGREHHAARLAESGSIDTAAPVTATASAIAHVSPDQLWDTLADVAAWPQFVPGVTAARLDGAVRVGAGFTWTNDGTRLHSTVRRAERGRELSWTGVALWILAIHRNEIVAVGDGARLTSSESMSGTGIGLLLPATKLAAAMQRYVDAIAAEAERRAAR